MSHEKVRLAQPAEVACLGKVPFSSFTLANAVVTRNREKHRESRSAYHCLHCHEWHIGTDNGQRARARHFGNNPR